MASTAPHLEFAPPHAGGSLRALALAILAHAVLLAVLSVGVHWNSEPVQQTFEAELWSAVPVEAAAPAPLPEPEPVIEPPKPVPKEAKPPPAPEIPNAAAIKAEAQIALEKEKQKEKQKEKELQKARELKEKKLAQEKQALEEKKLAELEKQQDKLRKEQAEKLARTKEEQQKKLDQKEAQQMAEQRQKAIKRMEGLAGAGGTGAANSTSTSLESRSLSASYVGRIRAYIKRFHTYTETVVGNPITEIEVRTSSDGSILSRRITKPSGTKSWDEAALNAIDKAERLPLDENGRAPSPMTIIWSAQEVAR
ncbi:protein TolA [Rhodoferax lacus]|uniref:Protein TolA n=1 Tax=Rhodoferax lacus TaxID=2184758 RepID=A0A3E1RHL7_9BURK|nr:energy transducer TonB [Rhodoferax lacus]RFO98885.1 protein TolA [Rhodoferax lacus]